MSNKLNINYLKKLKDSMFNISRSVHDLDNIDELYKVIHASIADFRSSSAGSLVRILATNSFLGKAETVNSRSKSERLGSGWESN